MSWFRENRFLGAFLISLGLCTFGAVWFLLEARGDWKDASTAFQRTAAELSRLERLAPYPSGENFHKMKAQTEEYEAALARLKDELKKRVLPLPPMAPNEFQSHLRVAMTAVAEKARANRVKLPDKFYLGFDHFASALPGEAVTPLLGQELAQIECLVNTLLEARVDTLISFRRTPLPEEDGTAAVAPSPIPPGRKSTAAPRFLERSVIEATFVSTPAAARKVLNQIAGTDEQFFVIRLLQIRNEKDKGPLREVGTDTGGLVATTPAPVGSPGAKPSSMAALNFIVGNERVETSARIEIVRFTF
jgi:hypothetical protein